MVLSPLLVTCLRKSSLLLLGAAVTVASVSQGFAAEPKSYLINEIQVTDAATYKGYVEQVPATLIPFGGSFLVRGGNGEVISGAPLSGRIVIVEFPSRAQAKAWHESPAYQNILAIRNASSTSRVYLVDGEAR